jgi:hypothetical protein
MFWHTSLFQRIHQTNNVIVCVFFIVQSIQHNESCCIDISYFTISYQLPDPLQSKSRHNIYILPVLKIIWYNTIYRNHDMSVSIVTDYKLDSCSLIPGKGMIFH